MIRKRLFAVLLSFTLLFFAVPTRADALANVTANTTISFSVTESLSISATPASVTLQPSGSQFTGASTPITVVTNWNLGSSRTALHVCQGLTLGTLPGTASNYQSAVNAGAAVIFGGTGNWCAGNLAAPQGADVASVTLNGGNLINGNNSSSVVISTVGLSSLAVGTYSGSITFTAAVTP